MSLVLAFLSMMGMSQTSFAAIWDLNFSSKSPYFTGYGVIGRTSSDTWGQVNFAGTTYTFNQYDLIGNDVLEVGVKVKKSNTQGSYLGGGNALNATKGSVEVNNTSQITLNRVVWDSLNEVYEPLVVNSYEYFVYVYTPTGTSVTLGSGSANTNVSYVSTQEYSYTGLLPEPTNYKNNVMKYYVTTNTNSDIVLNVTGAGGNINAIQIEGFPVPEPASVVMLGVGGLVGLMGSKRKMSLA
ncbi:MAG: PEP-CTERM sorting domain-containing protein [Chlorobiaceae bacterium]|nr:PEP-CTERM sorting domain-containing protein [Chlorobiaceae bacterium]